MRAHAPSLEGMIIDQDYEGLRRELACGADPSDRCKDGDPFLVLAISLGRLEMARILLDHGADPNAVTRHGKTGLHFAATHTEVHASRMLVKAGANVHAVDEQGQTPLIVAASLGRAAVVGFLLEVGADPNATFSAGWTSLHSTISLGGDGFTCTDLLLAHGANIDAQDDAGTTALLHVCREGIAQGVAFLLFRGANPLLANAKVETPLSLALKRDDPSMRDVMALLRTHTHAWEMKSTVPSSPDRPSKRL